MSAVATDIDQLCINAIRGLSIDAVEAANSGHPGLPLGASPMAYVLWTKHLRHNPRNPHWFNRDRFILSAGHGSMLLYSLLFLTGYDLTLDDIKQFRQWGSKTPGHPENILTPGVEMATGPLGQGFATSVGMAIAERYLAAYFNKPDHKVIDHYTFGICGDGDLMEGITNEAASLAGHLGLGKLIFIYDNNKVCLDGPTSDSFTEDTSARFRALGWNVIDIDGYDLQAVNRALMEAKSHSEQPKLISARSVIGFGSPNRGGTSKAHGEALGQDELRLTKEALGIPLEPKFYVNKEALAEYRKAVPAGEILEADWNGKLEAYEKAYPEEGALLKKVIAGDFGTDWVKALPSFTEEMATREASGKVINAIAPHMPTFIGGSADLAGSNKTNQKNTVQFQPSSPSGRNLAFGVREHAMTASVNGINLHGGLRAYGGTFLIFSDYCKPSLRLSSLMECPSIMVFTHDSIGLGEDGPTHQAIEQVMALRATPNYNIMRPADGNETAVCWKIALESKETPCGLALSRQALPALTPDNVQNHPAEKGAYILREAEGELKCLIVATGSEVRHAVGARDLLQKEGIGTRVVSMPSWLIFEKQSEAYRRSVFPKGVPSVSVEAGVTLGWDRYAQAQVGINRFGASAPGDVVMEKFGFTPEHVAEVARKLLKA